MGNIGKSVVIKGELNGSEDLTIEKEAGAAVLSARNAGAGLPADEWEIQPLDRIITTYVAAAVKATGGNVRKAARQLQISPSTLYARLKEAEPQESR